MTKSERDANLYMSANPQPGAFYNPRQNKTMQKDDFRATVIYILCIIDFSLWFYVFSMFLKGLT